MKWVVHIASKSQVALVLLYLSESFRYCTDKVEV
jgi:hypothetical protein